jgi:hypothetical protein
LDCAEVRDDRPQAAAMAACAVTQAHADHDHAHRIFGRVAEQIRRRRQRLVERPGPHLDARECVDTAIEIDLGAFADCTGKGDPLRVLTAAFIDSPTIAAGRRGHLGSADASSGLLRKWSAREILRSCRFGLLSAVTGADEVDLDIQDPASAQPCRMPLSPNS